MKNPPKNPYSRVAQLLRAIGQPARLKMLLAIGTGEACVCHLEAALSQRQVYISQQLMALREAQVLSTRREGQFIYYSLTDPALLDLIRQAARLAGLADETLKSAAPELELPNCGCPRCGKSKSARHGYAEVPLSKIEVN